MTMDYKALDTQKIRDYIDASVGWWLWMILFAIPAADKLRVYPALFELEHDGISRWRSGKSLERPSLFAEKEA